jgi:transcriptional regulator with XRE-family HTH domain
MKAKDRRKLNSLSQRLETYRSKEHAMWEDFKAEIRSVYAEGDATLDEIATAIGVSKARVWQIVRNKR